MFNNPYPFEAWTLNNRHPDYYDIALSSEFIEGVENDILQRYGTTIYYIYKSLRYGYATIFAQIKLYYESMIYPAVIDESTMVHTIRQSLDVLIQNKLARHLTPGTQHQFSGWTHYAHYTLNKYVDIINWDRLSELMLWNYFYVRFNKSRKKKDLPLIIIKGEKQIIIEFLERYNIK